MKTKIEKQLRKTIVLKIVDENNLLLKAPYFLSDQKINKFLDTKKNWIKNHVEKLQKKILFKNNFDFRNKIYLMGDYFCEVDNLERKSKDKVKNFYKSRFFMLEGITSQIANEIGLKFALIKPCSSVCVWGSFNNQFVMKLNWKLIILPKEIIEYVIIHELCHSKQMNHSAKFWKLVEKFCPNYKILKKQLNNYSFLLKDRF